jgi:hypothetical protein
LPGILEVLGSIPRTARQNLNIEKRTKQQKEGKKRIFHDGPRNRCPPTVFCLPLLQIYRDSFRVMNVTDLWEVTHHDLYFLGHKRTLFYPMASVKLPNNFNLRFVM